jgi:hypothetical protein
VAGAHEPLRIVVLAPGDSALHQERAKALKQALTERGVAEARCSVDLTAGSEPAAAAPAADAGSSEDDPEGMADDVPAADEVAGAEAAPASQPQEPYVFALSP